MALRGFLVVHILATWRWISRYAAIITKCSYSVHDIYFECCSHLFLFHFSFVITFNKTTKEWGIPIFPLRKTVAWGAAVLFCCCGHSIEPSLFVVTNQWADSGSASLTKPWNIISTYTLKLDLLWQQREKELKLNVFVRVFASGRS